MFPTCTDISYHQEGAVCGASSDAKLEKQRMDERGSPDAVGQRGPCLKVSAGLSLLHMSERVQRVLAEYCRTGGAIS